jgi:flagellar biosynthetic protein FliR
MDIALNNMVPWTLSVLLVVGRLSGLFLLAPIFSSRMIPVKIKMAALLTLSVTITPIALGTGNIDMAAIPTDGFSFMLLMSKELLVGFGLGFAVSLIFTAVQFGASLIDTSIGFSLASVFDPVSGSQNAIFGGFYTMVATLCFLSINGHHFMLAGFVRSFELVPLTGTPNFQRMANNIWEVVGSVFAMGFQLAAPVVITLLVVDVVLGVISRVVPQMNVFFVGIPVKIAVGLVAVMVSLPTFVGFFETRINDIVNGAGVLAGTMS